MELYFESSHLTTGGSTVRKSSISLVQEAPQQGDRQFPYYRRLVIGCLERGPEEKKEKKTDGFAKTFDFAETVILPSPEQTSIREGRKRVSILA